MQKKQEIIQRKKQEIIQGKKRYEIVEMGRDISSMENRYLREKHKSLSFKYIPLVHKHIHDILLQHDNLVHFVENPCKPDEDFVRYIENLTKDANITKNANFAKDVLMVYERLLSVLEFFPPEKEISEIPEIPEILEIPDASESKSVLGAILDAIIDTVVDTTSYLVSFVWGIMRR